MHLSSSATNQGVTAVSRKGTYIELEAKPGTLHKEHHFYLKTQLTNYVYSDLDIW